MIGSQEIRWSSGERYGMRSSPKPSLARRVTDMQRPPKPLSLIRRVTLRRLPKASVLVRVTLTEPPPPKNCAEAGAANVSEIARAAPRTARVFMTAFPFCCRLPIEGVMNHRTFTKPCCVNHHSYADCDHCLPAQAGMVRATLETLFPAMITNDHDNGSFAFC